MIRGRITNMKTKIAAATITTVRIAHIHLPVDFWIY